MRAVMPVKTVLIVFMLIFFLSRIDLCEGKLSKKKRGKEPKPVTKKPPPPKLNTDNLPKITEILDELGLSHREEQLRKKGVAETRHLLRLEKMDYHMMAYEWDGDAQVDVEKLKQKAAELLPLAIVKDEEVVKQDDRHKYNYGRIYIPGFVKSFEYISASFGISPPMGPIPIVFADPLHGCEKQPAVEGKMLVVSRGECTFLQKSLAAKSSKAALLVIVNTEDKLESVTTGYGIDKTIKNKDIEPLHKFSVVSTANTSLAPLQYALNVTKDPLIGHVVPLKCGKLSKCAPVTKIEEDYQFEVSWGRLKVLVDGDYSGPFDFLTSNYGGLLPSGPIPLTVSEDVGDACRRIAPVAVTGSAVLVTRGNCPFDVKVINVQNAGGSLVVFEDPLDRPLQRIGGSHPLDGQAGVPSIMIPFHCSEYIRQMSRLDKSISLILEGSNNTTGADKWIEVSYTQWAEKKKDKLTQLEGMLKKYDTEFPDIGKWLRRRMTEIDNGSFKKDL